MRLRCSSHCRPSPIWPRRAAALASVPASATGGFVGVQMDGDDALVRRIVDASVTPALLAKEGTTALLEACDAQAAVIFTQRGRWRLAVVSVAGCDLDTARALAGAASRLIAGGDDPVDHRRADRSRRQRAALRRRCRGHGRSRRRSCSVFAQSARSFARASSCAPRASGRWSRRQAPSSDSWSR